MKGSDEKCNMQEQMGYLSKAVEILRNNQKEILEIKNTETEMKTAFDELISRLSTAEERISELEDMFCFVFFF